QDQPRARLAQLGLDALLGPDAWIPERHQALAQGAQRLMPPVQGQ
ncbi:hypothetical protein ECTPHS_12662, partial [Ectothiorhodospira sp. PHS-1]